MSLFDKYGGERYWTSVLTSFLQSVARDEQLSHFFTGVNLTTLCNSLVLLFQQALGFDPGHFPSNIHRTHAHLDIRPSHFTRFVQVFQEEIVKNGVTDDDVREITEVLLAFQRDVVKKT